MTIRCHDKDRKKHGRNISEWIMAKAKELYFSYGLKSVSMDDLARLSGVSKKTIYQYYGDKDVLVHAVVKDQIQLHERLLTSCQALANEAIDEVIMRDIEVFGIWTNIHHRFFEDVEKYFPEGWLEFEFHSLKMRNLIIGNLEWGKKGGLYRDDMDIVLIAELRLHQQINLLRSQLTTTRKLSTDSLAKEVTKLYLRGITTEKGKLLLDDYFKADS